MKRYIFLTLVLTVIVIGPFAYQKWSESKRLQHIRETKQFASQIQATPLTDYLHELKQISPDGTPLLLFTGNTQAQLEPCGCFIGQSGGLPRRAKAIARIRETGFSPLLVDLGGIQPSQPQSMKPHSFEEVVCDILNACSVSETDVIIDTLADKHGSRSEVFEALTFLSKLSEIGVLFSPDQPEIESPPCGERPKIFLTAGILENRKNLRKSRLNLGIIHSRILLDP